MEAGDLIQAHAAGLLDWGRVVEVSSIVSGKTPGRGSAEDVTLFESQGLAIQDLMVAAHVYREVAG